MYVYTIYGIIRLLIHIFIYEEYIYIFHDIGYLLCFFFSCIFTVARFGVSTTALWSNIHRLSLPPTIRNTILHIELSCCAVSLLLYTHQIIIINVLYTMLIIRNIIIAFECHICIIIITLAFDYARHRLLLLYIYTYIQDRCVLLFIYQCDSRVYAYACIYLNTCAI